jgi:hypothetical protein
LDEMQRLLDELERAERKPEGRVVAYLYDPKTKRGAQVVERRFDYGIQANGRETAAPLIEDACNAGWALLAGHLPPPVPVRKLA